MIFLKLICVLLSVIYFGTLIWMCGDKPKQKPPREYQPGDVLDELV